MDTYRTIGEAWLNACKRCLQAGRTYTIMRGSYKGQQRKQLDQLAFIISHPGTRPLATEYRGMPISDDESINRYFEDYLIDPRVAENEQYTYASRIAPNLEAVAEMLRQSPATNQATVEVARPEDVGLADPPCLRILSWKATPAGLQLTSFWRSWDLYVALPTNLGGLQLLNETMAEWAGLTPGPLVCYSDGGHIYDHCWNMLD
jgi:thymidylate synthase